MKHIQLESIFKENHISAFLLDASGVIYNDAGLIPGIQQAIQTAQEIAPVFLVTNNSYLYVQRIAEKLQDSQIHIESDHIISSGLGLSQYPPISDQLSGKNIFIYGQESSYQYVKDAPIKAIVATTEKADVIIIASSLSEPENTKTRRMIETHLKHHPKTPIICCNPDRHVLGENGELKKVIGYDAEQIEKNTDIKIQWFGKPHQNYAMMVANMLEKQKIKLNQSVWFFDDNIENVINMKTYLGIEGCWVTDTGLGCHYREEIPTNIKMISSFSLEKE